MVKVDPKHNYYADLDLPPSCSIDDIKKQYRKLALLYHPDRNAGKEEEYVPKFQAIQTAHEVLGDQSTKQKYDADRRKTAAQPTSRSSHATPGNPYTANSAYPPPPRRTQPGTWQRPPSFGGAPPSGADRFTNFGRGAPTARKDPAQDRTNMFKAWQNMNSAQERQHRSNTPTGGQPNVTPNRPRPPPPPRPETNRPTEDEIRAGMHHRKAPPAYEADRAEARQSAWSAFNQSNSGRPGMGRPPSYRTPKKGGFDPNAPGSDERPATGQGYVHHRKSADFGKGHSGYPPPPPGPPPRSPISPLSPSDNRAHPPVDPLKHFKARIPSDEIPIAESNRTRTPYTSFSGERTEVFSEGLRRSASSRDTTKLNNEPKINRARSSSPVRRGVEEKSHKKGFVQYSSTESSETEPSGDDDEPAPKTSTAPTDRPKKIPKRPSIRLNGASVDPPTTSDARPNVQQKPGPNIFSSPLAGSNFAFPFAKPSGGYDIDTQFSPEGWNGTFTAADEYFDDEGNARKTESPTAYAGQQPDRHDFATGPAGGPPREREGNVRPTDDLPGEGSTGPKFSREEWERTFKDASWTWDGPSRDSSPNKGPPRTKSSSRKGGSRATASRYEQARTKPNEGDSADQPHVISDDEPAPAQTANRATPGVEQVDAMDIDPAPSSHQNEPVTSPSTKEPRIYAVPPSNWRQQQAQQVHSDPVKSGNPLDDLRHVEPLAPSSDGVLNLGDIGATLPFQSQASSTLSSQSANPQKLRIPPLPKAPEPPIKLSQKSWHQHAQAFGAYVQAYHTFNNAMLQHFVARQAQAQARVAGGTSWLEAAGETSGLTGEPLGFGSYLKGVREDAPVREAWMLGCERHAEAVEGFDRLRERVKRSVASGTLPLQ